MADLTVDVAGLRLPTPVVIGDGPTTYRADDILAAFEGGAGAVEVQATSADDFEEADKRRVDSFRVLPHPKAFGGGGYWGVATTLAIVDADRPWHHYRTKLERIAAVKRERPAGVILASIGSVFYRGGGELSWADMARAAVDAGADAVTLHLQTGNQLAGAVLDGEVGALEGICHEVVAAVDRPVIAKLPIEGCDPVALARRARDAGCAAVMPTCRFVGLDLDLETEAPVLGGHVGWGGTWALPNLLSWTARIHQALPDLPLVPGGGIGDWQGIAKAVLCGATAAHVCSWPMIAGYDAVPRALEHMVTWLDGKGYASLAELRGKVGARVVHGQRVWAHPRHGGRAPFAGVRVDPERCTGCGRCVPACWFSAMGIVDGVASIDPAACTGCGCCAGVCPHDAVVPGEGFVAMDWTEHA